MSAIKHKIDLPNARYYARTWLEIFDGGSDQWLYVAKSGDTYVWIEITDLPAYCGSDATVQWSAEVSSVDLAAANAETLVSALRCCGSESDPPDLQTEQGRLAMAEMLYSYGAKSPLWSDGAGSPAPKWDRPGENRAFCQLRAEARRQAEAMLDDVARDEALDTRIVNKIGQTAREYAGGTRSLWDSLRRIKDLGDAATPEQQLVLKMYGACEHTLGAGPIPEDLRLAKP